jgi:KipI family sensor histidine kinase inhibitor
MTSSPLPTLVPLGDAALLVRFGTTLSEAANRAAVGFARAIEGRLPGGVSEVLPSLVSVLVRYDPARISYDSLAGEVRLLTGVEIETLPATTHAVAVHFDGDDIGQVAAGLTLSVDAFVAAHNAAPLRVLATGFAPGFVYCGFHAAALTVPRRSVVLPIVPAGTVLFAAGQTAITATAIPTGWHVIGRTDFRNFDAGTTPPTLLRAGDAIQFEVAP